MARHVGDDRCQAEHTQPEPAVAGYTPGSFTDLYRTQYPRLVVTLTLAGAPDAADLAQEAFARTLRHWRRVSQGTNPGYYVATVAFRLMRRQRPTPASMLGDDNGAVDGHENTVVVALCLRQALEAMPARRRACAALRFYLGMSTDEAAQTLGITAGTVRMRLHRARADLRHVLAGP